MADLPRWKPDPIPTIHPVPEFAVCGARASVYERTKTGLGVPWMGVVAMAFAHYPRFYDTLWSAMEPMTGTKTFAKACRSLRDIAEREAEALEPLPLVSHLFGAGVWRAGARRHPSLQRSLFQREHALRPDGDAGAVPLGREYVAGRWGP